VQSTSIPGVAQRTGATTYYVEIYPAKLSELGARRPVMTLTPAPCYVDVMVASELLEAGRAMQNGFVTRDRTTLIASTHRIYTVAEKMHMGDGRFDSEVVLKAARALAKRAILFDMQAHANAASTVISAVMFGALAGSGTLPLSRGDCEAAIRSGGKGAEASLKGFAAGFDAAAGSASGGTVTSAEKKRLSGSERVSQTFPEETRAMLEEGAARCADFSRNSGYARLYLDRLEPIANLDRAADEYKLTNETGRFLALWMCYEDVIRVADLKTRRSRFERVREEVQAKPHEPVHIIEVLKPGVDELTAVLPRFLARPLKSLAEARGLANKLNVGMHVKTTSVSGFLLLRFLAWLRAAAASHLALARGASTDRALASCDRRGGEAGRKARFGNCAVRPADQGLRRHAQARQGQLPEDPRHARRGRRGARRPRQDRSDPQGTRGGACRPGRAQARAIPGNARHRAAAPPGRSR